MTARHCPGFHGKLPSRGDFIAYGMTGAFLAAWDAWLALGLEAARRAYGPDWELLLDDSPTWRFVLPPGLWTVGPVVGVMTPSRDKVERRYPFAFVCELSPDAPVAATPALCRGWFDRAERAARRLVAWEGEPQFARQAAVALGPPVFDDPGRAQAAADFIAGLVGPVAADASLWWCRGRGPSSFASSSASSLAVAPLVPAPGLFVALMDGQWTARGWRDLSPVETPPASPPFSAAGPAPVLTLAK